MPRTSETWEDHPDLQTHTEAHAHQTSSKQVKLRNCWSGIHLSVIIRYIPRWLLLMEGFLCSSSLSLFRVFFSSIRTLRRKLDLLIQILCGVCAFHFFRVLALVQWVEYMASLLQLFDALWRLHTTSELVWHSLCECTPNNKRGWITQAQALYAHRNGCKSAADSVRFDGYNFHKWFVSVNWR